MAIKYTQNFCDYFCCVFMKGGSIFFINHKYNKKEGKIKMNEYDYYNKLANWSFNEIKMSVENFTNWNFEEEIKKHSNKNSKILDLGTAGGEKVINNYPKCYEILGTDFSEEMIKTANNNLEKSGRKNIKFRVMNNLKMDTPENYFDIVTARHTVTDPKQIFKTLKSGGYLIIRGVDKLDCWELKKLFGRGQAYNDLKPISLIDYENVLNAGFVDVELIPIHIIEYFKTEEDLYALLLKTPILDNLSEINDKEYERITIEKDLFEKYVKENTTDRGIKLIRRYYGIIGKKK